MASIYRQTYPKIDPKTGKRVNRKLKKWYGKYRDADDILRKVPLCSDKTAAQAMLRNLVRKAERQKAGLADPFDEQRAKQLSEHLADFRKHLGDRENAEHHVRQTADRAQKVVEWCKFAFIGDISASGVEGFLSDLRGRGRSIQTSNHYLSAIKEFCRWLVLDRRTHDNAIAHLKKLNVETDRRHDRRALSSEEFAALVEAAANGEPIEDIPGPDRAMLYIVAVWTGYRRKEISSLTLRSLDLDTDTPTIRVEAAYSKRRRVDTIPLHPELVERLSAWLATKGEVSPDEPLFPLRTVKGYLRDTARMMRLDLATARKKWIEDTLTPEERAEREKSDHLCYQDQDGLFADFHANRHTFISNLAKVGTPPKVAQTLARHSDINLTMGVYTHVGLSDQSGAIANLPAPPMLNGTGKPRAEVAELRPTGTDGEHVPQHVRPAAFSRLPMAPVDRVAEPDSRQTEPQQSDETARFDRDLAGLTCVAQGEKLEGQKVPCLTSEPRVTGSNPVGRTCKSLSENDLREGADGSHSEMDFDRHCHPRLGWSRALLPSLYLHLLREPRSPSSNPLPLARFRTQRDPSCSGPM